ncbi:MAG: protein-glutamate O-methyltransferase CheR [Candidatus Hydrogenedentota bacterium]|nr:MAG: protein-glutamate O-methyltransferase CheR [Candidatus Hydrogenedentota bacterium]
MKIMSADLDDRTFFRLADFIYRETGIVLPQKKRVLLANRLRKRLQDLSLPTYYDYYNYLLREKDNEIEELINVVSTNETYFRRTTSHFEILRNYILPELAERSIPPIRIWSAGCSTGEEAYDLAIEAYEFYLKKPSAKFEVLGTDISTRVLKVAKEGRYYGRKVAKLSEYQKNRYFRERQSSSFPYKELEVSPVIKQFVTFERLNLVHDTFPTNRHIIFCRNVMIYFDKRTQKKIVSKMYNALSYGGYFIIGPSESLHIIESEFKQISYPEGTVYQKK